MKIKLMTLNIGRFQDWQKRKKKIISFVKSENPNVILLQEVCEDILQKDYSNQAEELNKLLKYPFCKYERVVEIQKLYKEQDNGGFMGLAILSNLPIISSVIKPLKFYPENKDKKQQSNQIIKIKTDNKEIYIINVHFENNDKSSRLQLIETLEYCQSHSLQPIIAGDFNMIITPDVKEVAGREYLISYELNNYKSFPPNNFSNNKEEVTLDYIIANKELFSMKNIICGLDGLSDHRPVLAEIYLNNL